MVKFAPDSMRFGHLTELVEWLTCEGLEPADIDAASLTLHDGWVSGYRYLRTDDGGFVRHGNTPVTVHFRVRQRNPLPDTLT